MSLDRIHRRNRGQLQVMQPGYQGDDPAGGCVVWKYSTRHPNRALFGLISGTNIGLAPQAPELVRRHCRNALSSSDRRRLNESDAIICLISRAIVPPSFTQTEHDKKDRELIGPASGQRNRDGALQRTVMTTLLTCPELRVSQNLESVPDPD